jgi:hypothetical protein
MRSLFHARAYLERHPIVRAATVAVLATVPALALLDRLDAAEDARRDWGDTVEVYRATADHAPGDPLRATRVELPVAAAPEEAVSELAPDARARQFLSSGAVIEQSDVTTVFGPAASATPGSAVVAVAVADTGPLSAGTAVDVVAEGIVLAERAVVTGVVEGNVLVAVERHLAPQVAAAAHSGIATVVFLP